MAAKRTKAIPQPVDLAIQQALVLDGMRYSVLMINSAYERLCDLLSTISDERNPEVRDFSSVLLDSWSIVDSVHRLRRLAVVIPGLKRNSPQIRLFLQRTKAAEEMRNFIQHADKDVRMLVAQGYPFWGHLSWLRVYDAKSARLCALKPGSFRAKEEGALPNPAGKTVSGPVDLITLHAAGHEVSLSTTVGAVGALVAAFPQAGAPPPGTVADALITVDWTAQE